MLDTLSDTKDICMTFANRILYDFLLALQLLSNHAPEGRPGMSDVSPLSGILGLSFDSTLPSALLFFCLVLYPFCLIVFCLLALSSKLFSRKFFNIFR